MHVLTLVLNVRHTKANEGHQAKKKEPSTISLIQENVFGSTVHEMLSHHNFMHHGLVKASKEQKKNVNIIARTRTTAWHVKMMLSEHETAAVEHVRISSYFW